MLLTTQMLSPQNASLIDTSEENRICRGCPDENATSEKSFAWAIELVIIDPDTNQITTLWAGGSVDCVYQWSNRKYLTYGLLN